MSPKKTVHFVNQKKLSGKENVMASNVIDVKYVVKNFKLIVDLVAFRPYCASSISGRDKRLNNYQEDTTGAFHGYVSS